MLKRKTEVIESFGERLAQLRKDAGFTQAEFAAAMLARALGAGLEELLGESNAATKERGPAPKLQQHMERISQLSKPQQRFVIQVLESVLAQQGR